MSAYSLGGRIQGYADEVDDALREFHDFTRLVRQHAASAGRVSCMRLEEGKVTELGTRGFLTRRRIIRVEYQVIMDTLAQGTSVRTTMYRLVGQMS